MSILCTLEEYVSVVNRTEARFGNIRFSVRLGLFRFFKKTEPNIYRIKSSIKGFQEVLTEIFS